MSDTPPAQSLSTILRAVTADEDTDIAFIIAGAINLYYDSLLRRGNRRHLVPDDIVALAQILQLLFAANGLEEDIAKMVGRPRRQ